ncbi:MAG: hypothetical protein IJ410_08640 [Oscillospiraceae bacterium]|nr:hypothetical protein [Oscillospiraceae bacterium]
MNIKFLDLYNSTLITNENIENLSKKILLTKNSSTEDKIMVIMQCIAFAAKLPIGDSIENQTNSSEIIDIINSKINNRKNAFILFNHLVLTKVVILENPETPNESCYISPSHIQYFKDFKKATTQYERYLKKVDL